jgi:LmbE family N-acetylglucosaminyl deacetylase
VKALLCSPHDDDSCLFAAFVCLRVKPAIVVVLDSYVQPNRGEFGCSAQERAMETLAAHAILGCETMRLGLRDDQATEQRITSALRVLRSTEPPIDIVYAPADQEGGNIHHNMVARAAVQVFGDKVRQYTTYTRTELYTRGRVEIVPTAEELDLKNRALECYVSQLRINRPHFDAVRGKSEWLV